MPHPRLQEKEAVAMAKVAAAVARKHDFKWSQKAQVNNCFAEMCSGSEEGSYVRLIAFCISQL